MPKKPTTLDPENPVRAEAELNYQLGAPVTDIATAYGVPPETVESWVGEKKPPPLAVVPHEHELPDAEPGGNGNGNGNGASSDTYVSSLRKFAVRQDFDAMMTTTSVLTRVPVRKPSKQSWIRVRSGSTWKMVVFLFTPEDQRDEMYIVAPDLQQALVDVIDPVTLHLTIDRGGVVFFWPIKHSGSNGKPNSWLQSASDAALRAEVDWIRLVSDRALGAYNYRVAPPGFPDPIWPNLSMDRLLDIALRDRVIDSMTHPLVRRLEGLA